MALCVSDQQAEIDADTFNNMIAKGNVDVIDVRELHETPEVNEFEHIRIPLAQIAEIAH